MRPSSSYDLNGDGYVSQQEFKIANKFDKDKDGILNELEKSKCLEALKQGWEAQELRKLEQKISRKGGMMKSRDTSNRVCITEMSPQKSQ